MDQARSSAAANSFMEELDQALGRISQFPALGAPYLAGTRRYLFRRFPFFVVYRFLEDVPEIQVFAISHGKRKPGYWKGRLTQH